MDMGKCFATCISYGNRQSVKTRFFLLSLVWIGLLSGESSVASMSISKYDPLVKKHARRYGFDWRLISAQMYAESSFRSDVVSHAGAVGLMQIMPSTAKWLGLQLYERDSESVDPKLLTKPEISISLGCYYDWRLYSALKDTDGKPKASVASCTERDRLAIMLASYNCGPGRMRRARRKAASLSDGSDRRETKKKQPPTPFIKGDGSWDKVKPYLPKET